MYRDKMTVVSWAIVALASLSLLTSCAVTASVIPIDLKPFHLGDDNQNFLYIKTFTLDVPPDKSYIEITASNVAPIHFGYKNIVSINGYEVDILNRSFRTQTQVKKTARIDLPKEILKSGTNELRIQSGSKLVQGKLDHDDMDIYEARLVVDSTGWDVRESHNFRLLYRGGAKSIADRVALSLEHAYPIINRIFSTVLWKQLIVITSTRDEFERLTGFPGRRVNGAYSFGELGLALYLNYENWATWEHGESVTVHEFAHAVQDNWLKGQIPAWFKEGYATYMAHLLTGEYNINVYSRYLVRGSKNFKTLDEIESSDLTNPSVNPSDFIRWLSYAQAFSFFLYIEAEYGKESAFEVLKKTDGTKNVRMVLNSVLGTEWPILQTNWLACIAEQKCLTKLIREGKASRGSLRD